MKIETLLHEEIKEEFDELGKLEVGSEQYKITVDGIAKLVDRAIEIDKLNTESEDRIDQRNVDSDLKTKQMKEDRIDRIVRNSIAIAGIVIPTVVTIWGTITTLEFEKEGTITTASGREFIKKLFKR